MKPVSNLYPVILFGTLLGAATVALDTQATQAVQQVRAKIAWVYNDIAPQMALYEIDPAQKIRLWTTKSVKQASEVPKGKPIKGEYLVLDKGERKKFLLVMHNPSDKPVYFFAAPHVVEPVEYSLGFKFKCLCINHAFSIGPQETWYRVVELRVSPDLMGDELTISHTLVGIDKARMEKFSMKPD